LFSLLYCEYFWEIVSLLIFSMSDLDKVEIIDGIINNKKKI
jgi:hypothetical protein